MAQDRVRVIRILEYEGPRDWVYRAIEDRGVKGTMTFRPRSSLEKDGQTRVIREAILGETAAVIDSAQCSRGDLTEEEKDDHAKR